MLNLNLFRLESNKIKMYLFRYFRPLKIGFLRIYFATESRPRLSRKAIVPAPFPTINDGHRF